MDLQSISNDNLHFDRYLYEYLALDTRYANEVKYGKSNEFGGSNYATYIWYIAVSYTHLTLPTSP
jgi:hypothetical protein